MADLFASARLFSALTVMLSIVSISACAPGVPGNHAGKHAPVQGEYEYAANQLFETGAPFDIRWKVTYPKAADSFDPSINVSDQDLTMKRCTQCHECGFSEAFDKANYGTTAWKPRVRGTDWANPVQRMQRFENSFLNEMIATRIYTFLRDETQGKYDVATDDKGAVVIEVNPDDLPNAD